MRPIPFFSCFSQPGSPEIKFNRRKWCSLFLWLWSLLPSHSIASFLQFTLSLLQISPSELIPYHCFSFSTCEVFFLNKHICYFFKLQYNLKINSLEKPPIMKIVSQYTCGFRYVKASTFKTTTLCESSRDVLLTEW